MLLKGIALASLLGAIYSGNVESVRTSLRKKEYEEVVVSLGDSLSNWYTDPSFTNSLQLAKNLLGEKVTINKEKGETIVYFTPEPTPTNTSQPAPIGPNLPPSVVVTPQELKDNYQSIKLSENNLPDIFYVHNPVTNELKPFYHVEPISSAMDDNTLAAIQGFLVKGENESNKKIYTEDKLKNLLVYVPNPTPGGTRKRKSKHRKTKRRHNK